MAQPTYGTHRVKNPGLEDGVWITDGKNGFEIPESRYRENGYKPRVEELPWRSSTWEGADREGEHAPILRRRGCLRPAPSIIQEASQYAAWVLQLSQRLGLDLAYRV